MKYALILYLTMSLGLANSLYGQSDWELSKQDEGISVYFRMTNKNTFEIWVTATFNATTKELTDVIYDAEKYPTWVYRCASAKTEPRNDNLLIISVTDVPWPFKDRDVVNLMQPLKQIDGNTILIRSSSKPDAIPENPNYIRLTYSEVTWLIKTKAENKIEIDYKLSLKIDQEAPELIIKMISTKGPFESFKNLKEKLSH